MTGGRSKRQRENDEAEAAKKKRDNPGLTNGADKRGVTEGVNAVERPHPNFSAPKPKDSETAAKSEPDPPPAHVPALPLKFAPPLDLRPNSTSPLEASKELEAVPSPKLYVGNLHPRVSEGAIIKVFAPFGRVLNVQFFWHSTGPRRGEPKGFSFVEFSTTAEAAAAIQALNGRTLCGRAMRVRFMHTEAQAAVVGSTYIGKKSYVEQDSRASAPPTKYVQNKEQALDQKVALLRAMLSCREGTTAN